MFNKLEFTLAGRYLRTKKREGMISIVAGLSIVGITLGVATLIIVLSVMNGFRHDLLGRILGVNSHVSVFSYERGLKDWETLKAELEKDPEVKTVTPTIEGNAVIYNPRSKGAVEGVKIRAVPMENLRANNLVNNEDFIGEWTAFGENENGQDGIIIGYKLAHALDAYVGNEITIITPQSASTVFGAIPRKKTFVVAGVFNVGMQEYDRSMVYMPLQTAQTLFEFDGAVESLGIEVKDMTGALPYAHKIHERYGDKYRIFDWQQANSQFFGAVRMERNMMFIILSMIILVASFNIISGMIMLVKDKSQSIAILRTMGMERRAVQRAFMLVGSFNGVVGTLGGVLLGLVFCHYIGPIQGAVEYITGAEVFNPEIYHLSHLPARVNWSEVAEVAGISLVISLLATIYPSWRAAKLDPAEALRYE